MANRRTTDRSLLISLMIIMFVVLNMITASQTNEFGGVVGIILVLGEVGLLGLWLGLGHVNVVLRWAIVVGAILLWDRLFKPSNVSLRPVTIMAVLTTTVASTCLSLRLAGYRLADAYSPASRSSEGSVQWSIANILGAMTVAAVLLALGRHHLHDGKDLLDLTLLAMLIVAGAWVVLGSKRIAGLFLIVMAIGYALIIWRGPIILLLAPCLQIVEIMALLVVRTCGFRIEWRPSRGEIRTASTPSDEPRLTLVSPDGEP